LIADHSSENLRDASAFLQDEWRPTEPLIVNFGLRFDRVHRLAAESKATPRVNLVYAVLTGTTFHAGYARYFIPPPQNEIAVTEASFAGTTGAQPVNPLDRPRAEADDYYDIGVQQTFDGIVIGLDGFWRVARNFLDTVLVGDGTFGQAFNYRTGRVRGIEMIWSYASGPFAAWSNLSLAEAEGQGLAAGTFAFSPSLQAILAGRFMRLDHDQTITASGGASYRIGALRLSSDWLYGSGMRRSLVGDNPNAGRMTGHIQVNFAGVYRSDGVGGEPLDLRLDIMNVFDVWYDDGGRPLAYLWKQIDRDAKTPDEAPSTPSTVIPSAEVPVAPSAGASGR